MRNATGTGPESLAVDPSGNFVYITNGLAGTVSGYAIDRSSGKLTAIAGLPLNVTPRAGVGAEALAIHPSGNFIYVTDSGTNAVFAYAVDPEGGELTAVVSSPFPTGTTPAAIAIDPAGKVVIVANQASNDLSTFTINSVTGALTGVAGSPFATVAPLPERPPPRPAPTSVSITPSGKIAYVANNLDFTVSAFSIDSATGVLAEVPGSPFEVGGYDPVSVIADPSGKCVYVLNAGSQNITAYSIDAPTGKLVAISSIRTRGQGTMIALSGGATAIAYTSKFAYVANNYGNTISAYTINPATGVLTNVAGSPFVASSPFVAGYAPILSTDPHGINLYFVNGSGRNISGFAIDQASGGLTEIPDRRLSAERSHCPCCPCQWPWTRVEDLPM
jgi:6-phosphogluconolactonase